MAEILRVLLQRPQHPSATRREDANDATLASHRGEGDSMKTANEQLELLLPIVAAIIWGAFVIWIRSGQIRVGGY